MPSNIFRPRSRCIRSYAASRLWGQWKSEESEKQVHYRMVYNESKTLIMKITAGENRQKPGSRSQSGYLKPGNYTCSIKHKPKHHTDYLYSDFPDVLCFAILRYRYIALAQILSFYL